MRRSSTAADALNRWLRAKWKTQSVQLKRAIAASEKRSSGSNVRGLLETIQLMDRHLKSEPVQDRLRSAAIAASKTNAAIIPAFQSFFESREVKAIGAALAGPVPPALQSFLESQEVKAFGAALAGPVPPALQSILESPGFTALKTILGSKDEADASGSPAFAAAVGENPQGLNPTGWRKPPLIEVSRLEHVALIPPMTRNKRSVITVPVFNCIQGRFSHE